MRFSWQGAPFTCGIHIVDAFANLSLSIEGSLFLPRCSLLIEERFRWSAFELESFESERYVESFELQTYSSFFTFLLKKSAKLLNTFLAFIPNYITLRKWWIVSDCFYFLNL